MKKMLVKAVALSLVLGGVGFVANDAQAAGVPSNFELNKMLSNEAGQRKANDAALDKKIDVNAKDIATNKDNINKNATDIATNKTIATKAYGMAQTEQVERKIADTQIREDMKKADKELSDKIDKNATDILVEKKNRESAVAMVDNKVNLEKQERENADKKLATDILVEKKNRESAVAMVDNKVNLEKQERENADKILNTKIDAEGKARYENDKMLNTKIDAETDARKDADNKLSDRINDEAKVRDEADKRIEAKFDGEVSRLDGRIDKLNDNVQKVGAMAAAIANLHTMGYDPEAPTEIAVGVGQYRDKTGLALGAFHYPNRDFMLSFNVSTAGDEFMGGVGATWRFGRKSPEELRQAEAEKAAKAKLAKAEAAKKAAKDARVAAQQKRHAEMLAARTGK